MVNLNPATQLYTMPVETNISRMALWYVPGFAGANMPQKVVEVFARGKGEEHETAVDRQSLTAWGRRL